MTQRPFDRTRRGAMVLTIALAGTIPAGVSATADHHRLRDGYMNHDQLAERVHQLAAAHDNCRVDIIGRSIEDRAIFALTLTNDFDAAMHRPALLITAGLDGRHWVGTETAVRVAELLLDQHSELLDSMTVYVIPRVNPDGTERNFGPINYGHVGNLRPVDLDRDGLVNEDGPNDLLDNGVITQMRRLNPTLDDPPTHLPDPNEPRLNKTPDRAKGEVAIYTIYTEGVDEDGDGRIAEDGPGGVDLDRNFPHLYPEHARDAGLHQLSEPETLALAEFVINHRNIAAAITYGRHDNMINIPDHRRMDITGRTPVGILEGDLQLYQDLSALFKETTGQKRAPQRDAAGSFHLWLYAHRGIPSIATVVWGRPDVATADDSAADEDEETQRDEAAPADADPVAGRWTGTLDLTAMQAMMGGEGDMPSEMTITLDLERDADGAVTGTLGSEMGPMPVEGSFDATTSQLQLTGQTGGMAIDIRLTVAHSTLSGTVNAMGVSMDLQAERDRANINLGAMSEAQPAQDRRQRGRRPQAAAGAGQPSAAPASDAEAAAWLAYSEKRGGIGFVEWQEYDHPQLGPVEIGGFVPGFKMNPPAEELDELAEKHAAFVTKIIDRRPKLRFVGPEIKQLGPGLFDVRFAIVNDGWLPTMTAMGQRARATLPVVLRVSTEFDRIVAGSRINRAWGIDGRGGRYDAHWMLREPEGTTIEIELVNHQLGDLLLSFPLREDAELTVTDLPEDRR